jgi:hypothetical protein
MTHDPSYVASLPSGDQLKRDFVATKGNGTDLSLVKMLRSGMTVAQVKHYAEGQIREHYLMLKSQYVELWALC